MQTVQQDYLPIILIGGGSSHGRGPDKEKAIDNAIRFLRDWESMFDVADIEVPVNVYNVTGYDRVVWGADGMHGIPEGSGSDEFEPIKRMPEVVTRRTPKWRKRK